MIGIKHRKVTFILIFFSLKKHSFHIPLLKKNHSTYSHWHMKNPCETQSWWEKNNLRVFIGLMQLKYSLEKCYTHWRMFVALASEPHKTIIMWKQTEYIFSFSPGKKMKHYYILHFTNRIKTISTLAYTFHAIMQATKYNRS